jgi:integrase
MILVSYRHGLRASEICELRWDDIDLRAAAMHVKRLKHGQDRHMSSAPSAASICASTQRRSFATYFCKQQCGPCSSRSTDLASAKTLSASSGYWRAPSMVTITPLV